MKKTIVRCEVSKGAETAMIEFTVVDQVSIDYADAMCKNFADRCSKFWSGLDFFNLVHCVPLSDQV